MKWRWPLLLGGRLGKCGPRCAELPVYLAVDNGPSPLGGNTVIPIIQEGPITHKYQFILPDKALDDLNIFKYTAFISV